MLLPAVQAARAAARRTQCQNNLKNVALAVLNYETQKGELPPGSLLVKKPTGTPSGLGWPVLILPFIEESTISEEAIERYKASTNPDAYGAAMDSLNALLPPSYLCPSDAELPYQTEKFLNPDRRAMSYAGVTGSYYARMGRCPSKKTSGEYCVCGGSPATDFYGPNNYDGLLIHDWPVSLRQATDGLSKTLLIGERWYQVRAGWPALIGPARPIRPPAVAAAPCCRMVHSQPLLFSRRRTSAINGRSTTVRLWRVTRAT